MTPKGGKILSMDEAKFFEFYKAQSCPLLDYEQSFWIVSEVEEFSPRLQEKTWRTSGTQILNFCGHLSSSFEKNDLLLPKISILFHLFISI